MKRRLLCWLLLLSLFAPVLPDALPFAAAEEVTLSVGDSSADVATMKKRLYELGYYSKNSFTKKFTEDTAEVVRWFQRVNGLEETGELSPADAAVLYSDSALRAPLQTPAPYATPAPTPEVDYPSTDDAGFLPEDSDEEFVYENDDGGLWVYISRDLKVVITRREDSSVPLIWFETEIWVRGEQRLRTVETNPDRPGTKFRYPYDIATDNNMVLAFSDDFYGDRVYNKKTVGTIIREGVIIRDKTSSKQSRSLPNLDVMAQYADGSLKVYTATEYTAQELLDMGAINVWCFGPIIIRDGEMSELMLSGYYKSREPRQALGMIEPNHYLLVSVQGRMTESAGCDLWHVAGIMLEHGVTEALNLDGGNTMALVFRGRMINKLATWKKKKFVRAVNSLIGVGYTENMAEE